jgi:hypothetical protein
MSIDDYGHITVSAECIGPQKNLLQEIQSRFCAAEVERHKAALAEVTTPAFAEWVFRPTAFESSYW